MPMEMDTTDLIARARAGEHNAFRDQRPGPESVRETIEAISLAFITALQLLPPRQRAGLVLRDVPGYHAAQVAQILGTTQEAVKSGLKRARATVDNHLADSKVREG
jgi:RNA polymerase sigma factor (sigma-70 family)